MQVGRLAATGRAQVNPGEGRAAATATAAKGTIPVVGWLIGSMPGASVIPSIGIRVPGSSPWIHDCAIHDPPFT